MTSSFDDIPEDFMDTLGEIFRQDDLGVIDLDDTDPIIHPHAQQEQQPSIPQVTFHHSQYSSVAIPTSYTSFPVQGNYQELFSNSFFNNTSSPSQSLNSESGFGDGSSDITTQSSCPPSSTPGLLSPLSDYSSHSPRSSTSRSSASSINISSNRNESSSDEIEKLISIHIPEGAKHKYRHAKEMKIGHGGLKGEIVLPPDYKTQYYRLILSVVPAFNSKQKIHPCMLHVTVMNQNSKQKRAKYRTKLESPKDWMVTLDVEQGDVYYVPNYEPQERFQIDCLKDGRLILGGNNLQMTIISPLQGKKEAEGIKLVSVIRERIQSEGANWNIRETPEQIAESYTSAKDKKVDLHMCRLRAQIYKPSIVNMGHNMPWEYMGEDISPDIIDGRDQNVGSFDLECMSEPNHCCTEGRWKVILISKYKTATVGGNRDMTPPVFPVFVFVDEHGTITRPEQQNPRFQQIDTGANNLSIHGGAFIFKVPPQHYDVVSQMTNYKKKLRLALYRSLDNTYSETSFDFVYTRHYEGCPFCIIRLGNEYMPHKTPTGNVKKRRRNTSFDVNPEHQQDWSPDSSPYNAATVPQEPGLSKIDFELELIESPELQSSYVQDGEPLKEKIDDKMFTPKKDYSLGLVSDYCHVYGEEKHKLEEKERKGSEAGESSTNEDSESGDPSDQEGEDSDYDNGANYDDNKSRKEKSNDEEKQDIKDATGTELGLKEDVPNAGDIKFEQPIDNTLNEKEITKRLENYIKQQENTTESKKNELTTTNPQDEKIVTHFSLFFMISVLISLIFGWVAGYFSLYNEFMFTFVCISMFIGGSIGFYFEQRITDNVKE